VTRRIHGDTDIRIGAQLYLKDFYSSFGFREEGEIYLEDGIPHVEMLLKA
jgi:ElaA protein